MSGREEEIFHRPALAAPAGIAISLVVVALSVIALYLEVILGLDLVPWRLAAAFALGGAIGVCISVWIVMRPDPVLVVDHEGLDWQLPGSAIGRIGWDRVEAFGLHAAGELARLGGEAPREKASERFIAVHLRTGCSPQLLAAFEMDVAPGLDEAIEALRRHRPDLERSG